MRKCASDTRPTDSVKYLGPETHKRLWSLGIRSRGELKDAVEEAIQFKLSMPANISKRIQREVLQAEPPDKVRMSQGLKPETPEIKAVESAWGFNNVILFIGSTVQGRIMLRSPSGVAKTILSKLGMLDLKTKDMFEGGKAIVPVEMKMKQIHAEISNAFRGVENIRKQYILGVKLDEKLNPSAKDIILGRLKNDPASSRRALQMTKDGWYNAITHTLRNKGEAPGNIPADAKLHIEAAAKIIRNDIYLRSADDLTDIGKKFGTDPLSYVMRIYDADSIRINRKEFQAAVLDNLTQKWTRKMGQAPSGVMRQKLSEQVHGWTETILQTPHQRAAKNFSEHVEGELTPGSIGRPGGSRTIDVDDDILAPFLRNDIREITSKYMNTRMVDLELTKMFGDVNMTKDFAELDLWYKQAIADAPAAAARSAGQAVKRIPMTKAQLTTQWLSDKKDLQLSRDIMRGTLDIPADPYSVRGAGERFARSVKDINYIRLGGGFALTAMGDIGGAMLVNGISRTMGDMHQVMMKSFGLAVKRSPLSQAEMEFLHIDWLDVMNLRGVNMFATGEYGGQGYSLLEKGLHMGSRHMAELSLLSQWTNFAKQVAARGVVRRMIDVAERAEIGKASPDELATIAKAYMSPHQLQQMLDLQRRYGGSNGGTKWLGIENWGGGAPADLVDAVRNVIVSEVDRAILTPGLTDSPIFFHRLSGSLLFQFRRFGMAHTQKLLVPAMQSAKAGDLQILNALAISSAMGSVVFGLKELANKREFPTDMMRILQEGVVRSDLWGKLGEVDGFVGATTGFSLREHLGPRTSLANANTGGYMEAIAQQLSPATYSTVVETGKSLAGFSAFASGGLGSVSEEQIRAWRRMAPFSTLFYMDWWFDMLENGVKAAGARSGRKQAMMRGIN